MQNRLAIVGIGKQTAKGAANATPAYSHGVLSGPLPTADVSQGVDDLTSASRQRANSYRESVVPGFEYTTRAYKASLGLYLLAALGSVVDSGAVTFSHVYGVGDTLPYLTLYSKRGGTEIQSLADALLNELTLSWDGTKPLTLAPGIVGCTLDTKAAAFPVATTDETDTEGFFVPVGGTFKLIGTGAVPAAAVVSGGSIKIANGAEAYIASSALTPYDIDPSGVDFELSLKVRVADFGLWREVLTGTNTGTSPAAIQYGSFEMNFVENRAGAATLKVEGGRVPLAVDLPDVDPKGGPVEFEISGIPLKNGSDPGLKFTLGNAVASY